MEPKDEWNTRSSHDGSENGLRPRQMTYGNIVATSGQEPGKGATRFPCRDGPTDTSVSQHVNGRCGGFQFLPESAIKA